MKGADGWEGKEGAKKGWSKMRKLVDGKRIKEWREGK